VFLLLAVQSVWAAAPAVHERTLPNGIRVAYLHVKDSADFSICTFLPMGLAFDDVDRSQWSHLIEHLVIRSTHPDALANVNAETLPDHMRLDFYGTKADWREGLAYHAKWLGGAPFTDESVRVEPGRANAETAYTVKAMATHKFAMAAWNQACRFGRAHVRVTGDLQGASRAALEKYRDERLVVPSRTLVCMIGGVEPEQVLAAAGESLGGIKSTAAVPKTAAVKVGDVRATWDLDARHMILSWPIPGPEKDAKTYATMLVLARLAWMQLTPPNATQPAAGMTIVAADLHCPESSYFYVSTSQGPDADWAKARKQVDDTFAALGRPNEPMPLLPMVAAQLAGEMQAQDPAALAAQVPPNFRRGLIEAQCMVTWGSAAYRLGAARQDVINSLARVTPEQLRAAIGTYVKADRRTTRELRPE